MTTSDFRSWQDLIWSSDPAFLRDAAELAERLMRTELAEALFSLATLAEEGQE
jgi:hypothetical protein